MNPKVVLCIEDDLDTVTLIKRTLETQGYTLLHAENGASGITMAENKDVELILLDIDLPDLDGYEVAQRLRNSKKTGLTSTPIIAVTDRSTRYDAIKLFGAGCDNHMYKPIDTIELLEKIGISIGKRK